MAHRFDHKATSPTVPNPAVADFAIRYRESQTERLAKLTAFVSAFAPAIGEDLAFVSAECPEDIAEARDAAIVEAFKAIRAIAAEQYSAPAEATP